VRINYVIGLVMVVLAIVIAFQNGGQMVVVDLLFWDVRTSPGLIIIGSMIGGLVLGSLIQIRAK
jgi:uncharacterized integral membrane protein